MSLPGDDEKDPPKHAVSSDFDGVGYEATRVDLGDDLLEAPAIEQGAMPVAPLAPAHSGSAPPPIEEGGYAELHEERIPIPRTREEIDDQLKSAEILLGENMPEDAKKALRRVLLGDPRCVAAREMLEQIHELELKQIFGEAPRKRRYFQKREELGYIDTEALMRSLDHDLGLGVFPEAGETNPAEFSLFGDRAGMEAFARKLDIDLAGSTARDRLDVGIAFLEMGLPELGARQFKAAMRDHDFLLPATNLLSSALIQAGRPFEATLVLEQVLGDTEVSVEDKVEFVYLMGRASEQLKKPEVALQWYRQACTLNPHYRDASDRILALVHKLR